MTEPTDRLRDAAQGIADMLKPAATPAPHSGLLRTAADRTSDEATAALLRTLADTADHRTDATIGVMGTVLHPAVVLARNILDTEGETTAPPVGTDLRDRIAQAARDLGHPQWDAAALADAVLSVLPAPTDRAAADQPADRRTRYAGALAAAAGHDWNTIATQYPDDAAEYRTEAAAVMAVADAEQQDLRAEVENRRRYIKCLDTDYDGLRAEWGALRAEVERLRTDRAAVLSEGADAIVADNDRQMWASKPGQHWAADLLRRLADEAQQPETEADESYVPETDHPGAELFVLLRKAGLEPDTARRLIRAHAAMAARMTQALDSEPTPAP